MSEAVGRGARPLRIAYGRIFHEANAFSPLPTTQADFERVHHVEGEQLAEATTLLRTELASFVPHAELTGFRVAARLAGGVAAVPLVSSLAVPGGPLTRECFEWLLGALARRLSDAGPLDGVYLALHGCMEVRGLDEPPEGVILRRVREILGNAPKIAVSLDLHANLRACIVDQVDTLIAYRTNPHWDLAPTGFRAGNRLIRSLRGRICPTHAWRKLPVVLGGGRTIDFMAPMRPVFRWIRRLERNPRVLSASLFMVHPYASAEDLGWAVHVCTDGDTSLADDLAVQLADRVWAARGARLPRFRSIHQALDEVSASKSRKLAPITLIDTGDIVGAGAPGGSTQIVEALVENDRGLRVLIPVHDPVVIAKVWNMPRGAQVPIVLRGTENYRQRKVPLIATVGPKHDDRLGRVIRLDVGSFHIAVSDRPPFAIYPRFWRQLGINPRRADAIVQKSFFLYRIFYAAISFVHLPVVSDGATSLERVKNRIYRVPSYPAQDPPDWRSLDPPLRAAKQGRVAWTSKYGRARPRRDTGLALEG